jgi:hypothetical protein
MAPPILSPSGTAAAARVQIRSVVINARNAGGGEWDVMGGDPDPYVVITSVREGRELHRTATIDDDREARFDQWIPAAVPAASFPLRVVVYDEDVAGDEVIGAAQIEASALNGGEADVTLELRSRGENAGQTGVLRIRVQPQR